MSHPTYVDLEEYQLRAGKLDELRKTGIEPYPHTFPQGDAAEKLAEQFADQEVGSSEDAEQAKTPAACISGRLVLFRAMGKNAFGHLQDATGRLQVMFNKQNTEVVGYEQQEGGSAPIKIVEKKFDLGDILGVEGHLFRTQKGELTLYVKKVTLLCKTLLPLPDKHSGLSDKGVRYRKRWLDLISSPQVKETFYKRSHIIRFLREFLHQKGFMEVETPVLQSNYGGAEARPFITQLNALDEQEMFLRISLEISLKKLLIGGFDRVFEIGKIFRNEGIDRTHNPEFTMLEAYAANWDYNDLMHLLESFCEQLALNLYGTTKLTFGEQVIDVKAPWKRMTMLESIQEYAGIEAEKLSESELREILSGIEGVDTKIVQSAPWGRLIQMLFEEKVESHLIQPHHITDHPIETTPLCKPHREEASRQRGLVERFESFIFGAEICNAYSELNDPLLQRELLEKQLAEKIKTGEDAEAHPIDEEFLEAICQGMPPTGGIGIGIDRLVMLFTNSASIRDVLFFPLMRRLEAKDHAAQGSSES